ncbi:hypothetical protein AM625_17545, partial [Vibrio cholerae O1 biovar El Tor]
SILFILLVANVVYDVVMRYAFNDVSIAFQELECESAAQPTQATPSSDDADPKKAAVAAAIARAKARKAAQQSSSNLNAEEKD